MTTSNTATSVHPTLAPPTSSGAAAEQWRDTSPHSTENAPLDVQRPWLRRGSLLALLGATALLYLWALGASGYANDFYAAAVQAGTQSWKAFFYGSFDSSNFITVDKPPASLWPMEISGRIFGFNSWSMLAPQAIEGVLAVWLLYASVKRWFGHWAGIGAGALLALTPVAVLMFRFNNPDSLMVLLMVLAAYCTTRAIEKASTRWLLLAGVTMGFSFLAKGLQPFTLIPALAIAYLVAAPTSLRRRILQVLGAGVGIVVGAGWWILAVQLTPASSRPYIGGSGDNSPLGLAFGYNGISRLSSSGGGPGGGGGGGASFSGSAGIGRLFNSLNAGQIAWLLPTSIIAIVALVVASWRAPRVDRTRAAVILWGGWLLVTGAVLSFAGGIIHTYYTVELAPAIAALVAIGAVTMWRSRQAVAARLALAAGLVVSGFYAYSLLHKTPTFYPWLAWLVVVAAIGGAVLVLLPRVLSRALAAIAVVAAAVALVGGPAAYALNTAGTPHTGSTPSAGPAVAGGFGGPGGGGMRRPGGTGGAPSGGTGGFPGGTTGTGGTGGPPSGTGNGSNGSGSTGSGSTGSGTAPTAPSGTGSPAGGAPTGARTGGAGGGGATISAALKKLIENTDTRWAAATIGSQSAGPIELATGKAVMSIGGFTGSDDSITLAQFKAYVAAGKIHYFIGGGGMGGGPGGSGSANSAISTWVSAHFTATTVGSTTVYDLTKKASS